MRRVPPPEPTGYFFLGDYYESEADYLAAYAKWRARRARLLALVEDDSAGGCDGPQQ